MPSDEPRLPAPAVSGRRPSVVRALVLTFLAQIVLGILGIHITLWIAVLGAVALQHWFLARNFPALVAGGLILGAGVAAIARDIVPGAGLDSFLGWMGWAAGFGIIAGLGGRAARWAYGGVLITAVMGIGALGLAIGGAVSQRTSGVLVPLLTVTIGLLLLLRGSRRGRLLLLVIGGLLLVVSSSMSDSFRAVQRGDGVVVEAETQLPDLRGRTLVIESALAPIRVVTGAEASVSGEARVDRGGTRSDRAKRARNVLTAVSDDDAVVLDSSRIVSLTVTVPAGTDVEIDAGRGPVQVDGRGGVTDIEADNAPVTVTGWFDRLEVTTDNGPVEAELRFDSADRDVDIETDNGAVQVRYSGTPQIDVETDNGPVRVGDDDAGDGYELDGDEGDLQISTDNGPIRLRRVEPADLRVPLR